VDAVGRGWVGDLNGRWSLPILPSRRRGELARSERHAVIRQAVSESIGKGVWGWADDDLAFVRPPMCRRSGRHPKQDCTGREAPPIVSEASPS